MRLSVRVAVALALLSALAPGCADDAEPPSRSVLEEEVTLARDRVDVALRHVTQSRSLDEFLARMDEAAETIEDAASDVRRAAAPEGLEQAVDELADALSQLAVDVQATADQVRQPGFEDLLAGVRGLSFESWDAVNRALAALRPEGVEVELLERHAPTGAAG